MNRRAASATQLVGPRLADLSATRHREFFGNARSDMKTIGVTILFSFLALSCEPARTEQAAKAGGGELTQGSMVDLSHSYDADTIFWPTEDGFRLEKEQDGINDKGFYYASNKFTTAEHGGTHIDAPRHFAQGHRTVDQIPLDQLIGQAIVVDVSAKCAQNPDYLIATDDLQQWEQANGAMPAGTIVIFRTGYGKRWPDRKTYLGTDERGAQAVAKLHFPGLSPDAARWLLANRSIKAVGLDTASIDYGQSTMFETHRALFEKDVPAFENLANLETLPIKGFTIVALPMKIAGGSGGPLRIVAILGQVR
jgi:kynurenine formamidase